MPSTPEIRNLQLAERFHVTPLEVEEGDADRWLVYLHVLGVEGEVRELTADMPDDERLFREGD